MMLTASIANHAQAAAWIVAEARERVPGVVHVPDDATLPAPQVSAGEMLALEPPQVVGKHSRREQQGHRVRAGRARLSEKCERVYHRANVPEACECGASLQSLRAQAKTA